MAGSVRAAFEPQRPPLLQLRRPDTAFTMDVVRLLMNPIAGGVEPLGRRLHPLGAFPFGLAIRAIRRGRAGTFHVKARWRMSADLEALLHTTTTPGADGRARVRVDDETGETLLEAEGLVSNT